VAVTIVFVLFTVGFFLVRTTRSPAIAVREAQPVSAEETLSFAVNINTADKEALMTLPGIGEVLADRILEYRRKNDGFQSVTELMLVEGIGEKRMEELLDYITTGG